MLEEIKRRKHTESHLTLMGGRLHIVRTAAQPKEIYRFGAILIKIAMTFLQK